MQRYFAIEKKNDTFLLKEEDLYHIKVVMRMKDQDKIIVVYKNQAYLCNLEILDDIKVHLLEELIEKPDFVPFIRLVIPLLKEQKMDYIFQKATELGVSEFVLYEASRSIIKVKDITKKLVRWNRIVKEASEQSHRTNIPIITELKPISFLEQLDGVKILCSTREKSENIKNALKMSKTCDKMNIVIGPEGGLSTNEEEKLRSMKYTPITLGSRILRVETVPLFIMSVINYEYME